MKTTWIAGLTVVLVAGCSADKVDFASDGLTAGGGNDGGAGAELADDDGSAAEPGAGGSGATDAGGEAGSGVPDAGEADPFCTLLNASPIYVESQLADPEGSVGPCPLEPVTDSSVEGWDGSCTLADLGATCVYHDLRPGDPALNVLTCELVNGDTAVWSTTTHVCRREQCNTLGGEVIPLDGDCKEREVVQCAPYMVEDGEGVMVSVEGETTVQERLDWQISDALSACAFSELTSITIRFENGCATELSLSVPDESGCVEEVVSSKHWACAANLLCSEHTIDTHPM